MCEEVRIWGGEVWGGEGVGRRGYGEERYGEERVWGGEGMGRRGMGRRGCECGKVRVLLCKKDELLGNICDYIMGGATSVTT